MKMFIVVLRSKSQVMEFIDIARSVGLTVKAIPLPKEVKIGCGICVRIMGGDTQKALFIVKKYRLDAFYGIYCIEKQGMRSSIRRIY